MCRSGGPSGCGISLLSFLVAFFSFSSSCLNGTSNLFNLSVNWLLGLYRVLVFLGEAWSFGGFGSSGSSNDKRLGLLIEERALAYRRKPDAQDTRLCSTQMHRVHRTAHSILAAQHFLSFLKFSSIRASKTKCQSLWAIADSPTQRTFLTISGIQPLEHVNCDQEM